jgi:hypothetical protein
VLLSATACSFGLGAGLAGPQPDLQHTRRILARHDGDASHYARSGLLVEEIPQLLGRGAAVPQPDDATDLPLSDPIRILTLQAAPTGELPVARPVHRLLGPRGEAVPAWRKWRSPRAAEAAT